jgi:RNA-directed DNA polymerase
MKKISAAFDQITSFRNLMEAAGLTLRGHRHQPVAARFWFDLETEVLQLQEELTRGVWQPRPYRVFTIYESKPRQICASDLRDRVVHHAICRVLDPVFERRLTRDTYACRRGMGSHAAVKRAQVLLRGADYVLQCDVSKYFASIDHGILKDLYRKLVSDQRLLEVLDRIVDHPVPGYRPGCGMPIGNLTSQYFANLYLGELDHFVKERLRVKGYVRYMDDWLLLSDDKGELHRFLAEVRHFLESRLRLTLKERAVRIAPVSEGVTFLGFQVYRGMLRLGSGKLARVRRTIRHLEKRCQAGLIDEEALSRSVSSMLGHWSQANTKAARRQLLDRSMIKG